MDKTPGFTVEEVREGCADLWGNVECMTCSRLLGYIKSLLDSRASVAAPDESRVERLQAQLNGVMNALATSQQEVERLRATSPVAATVDAESDDLHLAICQAVHLMNQGDLHAGHDLLRQTLVDFADKKAPQTRSEIVRQQQRSGSGAVSAIMVSPATPSDSSIRAVAAEIATWMNWKAKLPEFVVEQNATTIAAILSKHLHPVNNLCFPKPCVHCNQIDCKCSDSDEKRAHEMV